MEAPMSLGDPPWQPATARMLATHNAALKRDFLMSPSSQSTGFHAIPFGTAHSGYTAVMRKLVGLTRYTVFVPAIASILGALFLMAQGSIAVVIAVINSVVEQTPLKDVIVEVLTAVDAILLGTVLLVIGYGLYELFVDTNIDVPAWLQIKDLDDLKSKLIGVVVAIIAVVFVGVLVDSTRAGDVLAYGAGAGAVVLGLGVFAWATRKSASPDKR